MTAKGIRIPKINRERLVPFFLLPFISLVIEGKAPIIKPAKSRIIEKGTIFNKALTAKKPTAKPTMIPKIINR